ncbi:glycoside hydrolase family 3 C-terminal domain-containing protein [Mycobacterium sp. 1274761.0]|uniref:glycoside hydrolase family 3 C-terminal domain-containing protein n=1 Tax=Mycobacterium sp. 1274761.0 TaxID=1834077 RepID=UPI0007FEDBA0|nr:glycoside hydrolase family 3 C-terminal domain-containing protein [Mycobacterium sp. 1274761.0]OBK76772.1 glycosyl hydrolase [Mycobacterium sp. 1274761.0]
MSTQDLTLTQRAALISGVRFWYTKAIEEQNIPSIMLTDGPHGVRKHGERATCFPPAVGLGCSWDVDVVERVGAALGAEAAAKDVGVLLGPGINIKRSPLCGRNFEYFSEDPVVSGVLGAAMVAGIQSRGVGASAKHFAANNQERDRMRVSADVDARPLREIYLRGFERVVEDARPWTVMCAYNRINGIAAVHNPWLLATVLRDEWGFDGVVVSDWGAVDDSVASLAAGVDLDMPGSEASTQRIVAAVEDGILSEERLDTAADRVLALVRKAQNPPTAAAAGRDVFDVDAHHALAREAAARSIVVLKNVGAVLPLAKDAGIAVVGALAVEPRYQGAGSSQVTPTRLDTPIDEIRAAASGTVTYTAGHTTDEAAAAAAAADVAVVFVGLPEQDESEGYDRDHIDLPAAQLALVDAVVEANPNTVVVVSNGGVVALPFADTVPAIVEGWLLGQAGGGAIADVLFGDVNPSGKLTETIPRRLADTPAYLDFPGEFSRVRYGEGIFVGYRWYDARDLDVAFPFGHGLSYTTFGYRDAAATVGADGDITVRVTVTNTGAVAGREIVQAYTALPDGAVQRPPRELKAFASVELAAAESREIVLTIRRKDLAYWDIRVDAWVVEGGRYSVEIAASSRDIRATVHVDVIGDDVRLPLSRSSSISEVLSHPVAGPLLAAALPEGVAVTRMLEDIPIGKISTLAAAAGVAVDQDRIDAMLAAANAEGSPRNPG